MSMAQLREMPRDNGGAPGAHWGPRPRSEIAGLACVTAGPQGGVPVVLLHGVGLRAEAWGAQLEALSGVRLIAPDMPGHGESAALDAPPSLAAYTDRLARLVATLATPVVVVGHSMGAMIALDLGLRHPGLCRGVVALSAIYRRSPAAAAGARARAAALVAGGGTDPAATLHRWFGDDQHTPVATACRGWLTEAPRDGYSAAYGVFTAEDGPADDALQGLHCPALFLTGALDPNSTPAMSEAMAARVPGGRAITVPGAAHMVPMTHPQAVNAAILAVAEQSLGAGVEAPLHRSPD
ncbi:MAG: alpha/beta hydrolase [Pseudomonadota bacterium]